MIFVTVGSQLPFDRLVKAVDNWAKTNERGDVFAQIGKTRYRPKNMQYIDFLDIAEFRAKVVEAEFVVAHAGMGTIITAIEVGTPILVMPRRADLGEHRSNHQMATPRSFFEQRRISLAVDEGELVEKMERMQAMKIRSYANEESSSELVSKIRDFIRNSKRSRH